MIDDEPESKGLKLDVNANTFTSCLLCIEGC